MRAKLLQRRAAEQETGFGGIPIVVEWPKGSTRTGTDREGKPWERKMMCSYGCIPDTVAVGDGEDLDVYIGEDRNAPEAYAIEQLQDDGSLDEIKMMLGFRSLEEARSMYLQHYPKGWEDHVGDIFSIPVSRLRGMVAEHQSEKAKTARYLTFQDLEDCFDRLVRPSPAFKQALRELGGGKDYDALDKDAQNAVCRRTGIIEQGFAR